MKNKKKLISINTFYTSLNTCKKYRGLKKTLKRVVKESLKNNLDVEYELHTSRLLNKYYHLYDNATYLINF